MPKLFFHILKIVLLVVVVVIGLNVYVIKTAESDIVAEYTGAEGLDAMEFSPVTADKSGSEDETPGSDGANAGEGNSAAAESGSSVSEKPGSEAVKSASSGASSKSSLEESASSGTDAKSSPAESEPSAVTPPITEAAAIEAIGEAEVKRLKSIQPQCILVLGASVKADGTPSAMLRDRLETAIALYYSGVASKLLLSGDNGQTVYNEVESMKKYAVKAGVPEGDIFLDHAGFSTYESIYRAQYIFQVDSMVVVTQEYHLYRTLYGCKKMGIDALGVSAAQDTYSGQELREVREILARDKDCVKWIFKPEPTFLGDAIPISGNGTATH